MDVLAPGTEFPVAYCAACEKEVLCYADLDVHGCELVRCVECAATADPSAVRWLDLHDLEGLGYGFVLPEGGCGRPDCGRGRCGRAEPTAADD